MHARELWILVLSAALVLSGGLLELSARRVRQDQGFPWLFAFSVICLAANFALIAAHRFA